MAEAFEILGIKELEDLLKKLGPKVEYRAAKKGLTKAASRLRTRLRQAAPKRTGMLRQAIQVGSSRRNPIKWVGLRPIKGRAKNPKPRKYQTPYYYVVLERRPETAFFAKTVEKATPEILRLMKTETRKALYFEAGKMAARNLSRSRGRR